MKSAAINGERFSVEQLGNGVILVSHVGSGLRGMWDASTGQPHAGDLTYGISEPSITNYLSTAIRFRQAVQS